MKLAYEAHVTIEPVEGSALENFEQIAKRHGFRVANLIMSSFATGRGETYSEVAARCGELVRDLKAAGFTVWRYKVEHTLLDVDFRNALPSGEPRESAACSELNEG